MKKIGMVLSVLVALGIIFQGMAYAGGGADSKPGKKGTCKTNFGPKHKHAVKK